MIGAKKDSEAVDHKLDIDVDINIRQWSKHTCIVLTTLFICIALCNITSQIIKHIEDNNGETRIF